MGDGESKEQGRRSAERRSVEGGVSASPLDDSPASESGQPTYLVIGRIAAPRGVKGELRVKIETEDPERFEFLRVVYLGTKFTRFQVGRARLHGGQALLQLVGLQDRNAAERWRGAYVHVHIKDALPLAKDEYYHYQIKGLVAVTVEGEMLGRVIEVLPTGANDVYLIDGEKGELLLPAIKDVIIKIDADAGIMLVRVPDGLR